VSICRRNPAARGRGCRLGPRRGAARTVEDEDRGVDLVDDGAEGHDVEHALAAAHKVDDLLARPGEDGAFGAEHEVRGGELTPAGAQAGDRPPRLAEVHPGVEELLDHLELDDVAVGVEALRARAVGVGERRAQQSGARPVVELAVGDADDLADLRAPEALLGRRHRAFLLADPRLVRQDAAMTGA